LWFSAAGLWEVATTHALGHKDFHVEPRRLRRGLIANGWRELAISSEHAVATLDLPPIQKDPFDRMLVAQAQVEGLALVTSDELVARYPGVVHKA
jgi:PIN domain nuclease of toxin-antitoxin system